MTTQIRITDSALRAIERAARGTFVNNAEPDGDGWLVPFTDEVAQRLEVQRLPGEDASDTILRLCAKHGGFGLN